MKISELRLERFGHFADATLHLDRAGLTLLHGANEAGKSTLLAALRAFLFGFPRGAAWDFRWPSETLAIGGTLAFADGAIAELRREKKRGLRGQLKEAAHDNRGGETALTDEILKARLGRPSAEMFSTVFAFSLEDLARGGEALRDEGLRAAIAGAGLGAARSPQAVIQELRDQAESLFTVKGRAGKLINATLADIKERELERRKVEARGDDYEARVRARDEARAEAETLGRRRRTLLLSIGEREALLRALPRRDELRGAHAERAALPPSTLPPDAGEHFERARQDRVRLQARVSELRDKLGRVEREAEKLEVDEALLVAAPRIRPLHEGLGRHAEESRQADELAAAHRTRRLELGRQLAALRPGWALDDLDVLPGPLFTSGLERLREGWSGHHERARELERLEAARRELAARRAALRRRLDPPWPLPANGEDEPAFLPVPRAEELKRHRDALGACERAIVELRRDDDRLLEAERTIESQLSRLDAGGAVPSAEELARLRALRDAAWAELKRAGKGPKSDRAALEDAFEGALRAADTHADELRRRSDDVAKRAELELRRAEIARARADRASALERAESERAAAERAWHALWSRCGFVPQSPETMLEWLSEHAELRKHDAELVRLDEQVATLRAAQEDYERRIAAILETLAFDPRTELAHARRIVTPCSPCAPRSRPCGATRSARASSAPTSPPGATRSSGCATTSRRRWPRSPCRTRRRRCARSPSGWPRRKRRNGCARSSRGSRRSWPSSTPRPRAPSMPPPPRWRSGATAPPSTTTPPSCTPPAPPAAATRSIARSRRSSAPSPRRAAPPPPTSSPPRSRPPSAGSSTASSATRAPSSSASTSTFAPPPSASAPPRRRSSSSTAARARPRSAPASSRAAPPCAGWSSSTRWSRSRARSSSARSRASRSAISRA